MATNLYAYVCDSESNPLLGSKVTLRPYSGPYQTLSGQLAYTGPVSTYTDITGLASFPTVVPGTYKVSITNANANNPSANNNLQNFANTIFYISVPETNGSGSYNVNTFIINGINPVSASVGSPNLYLESTDGFVYEVSLITLNGSVYLEIGQTPTTGSPNGFVNYPILGNSSSYSLTSSFSLNGGGGGPSVSSSYANTSSWAINVVNGSTFNGTSSIYGTSSWANNSINATYIGIGNTSGVQNLYIPMVTSTGSNQPLNADADGVDMRYNTSTKVLTVSQVAGTSSWANNVPASGINGVLTATQAPSSSYSNYSVVSSTTLFASSSVSSSYASASTTAITATNLGLAAYNISVTYASQSQWAVSSSFASSSVSSSFALSASYALNGGSGGTTLISGSTYPITASWATNTINGSVTNTSANQTFFLDLSPSSSTGLWPTYGNSSLTYNPSTTTLTVPSVASTASWATNVVNGSSFNGTSSIYGTASWANSYVTASVSYVNTYTTITTSSLNWITCSFSNEEQYVSITTGLLYNFTQSNVPSSGQVSDIELYINNTSTTTSSLSFPSNWVWMGIIPSYLSASKNSFLSLKAYGPSSIVASWGQQF